MIVIDTSALMAVVLNEPEKPVCAAVLQTSPVLLISAATLTEAGIVAARRSVAHELQALFDRISFNVVGVDAGAARRAVDAYRRFGKGFHPARLNFGDCFAYELAQSRSCPLLYVGEDFAQTDVRAAVTDAP